MSTRVEWFDAHWSSLTVVRKGTEIGAGEWDEVTEEAALLLSGDEAAVLEGSASRLRDMLTAALAELDRQFPAQPEDSDDFPAPGPWGCDDDDVAEPSPAQEEAWDAREDYLRGGHA